MYANIFAGSKNNSTKSKSKKAKGKLREESVQCLDDSDFIAENPDDLTNEVGYESLSYDTSKGFEGI